MSGSCNNNFSCYRFSSNGFVESLRNPYDREFRTPFCYPPPRHPRGGCSPHGYTPRQSPQNANLRHKRPHSQLEDNLSQDQKFVTKVSPCGRNSSYVSTPSSNTSDSPFPFNPSSLSGFANRSSFTPKNSFQDKRHNRYSFNDSNIGWGFKVSDYYNSSMFSDPWIGLKPITAKPKQTTNL